MCEYCEYQLDQVNMQEEGLPMYVCNSDQIVVEDEDGNVVSHATINFCPMCGEMLV